MAETEDVGRPMPLLVLMLLGSFTFMVLSGVFYGLGLSENWARAMFMATVLLWVLLGIGLIIQGQAEKRAFARAAAATTPPKEAKDED
jgi:hypothetical protein